MKRLAFCALVATAALLTGCSNVITGSPTWPGAKLEKAALTAPDFPPGTRYDRIVEQRGQPDGVGGPAAMLSVPEGCSDGLTRVIADGAERGPGSALKYSASYDGARIVMTVLSWRLNIDRIAVFGMAFPTNELGAEQPPLPKATLPQTFIAVVNNQAEKVVRG